MPVRHPSASLIETLEARRLMIAAEVSGSSSADEFRVSLNGNTLLINVNGSTQSFPDFIYDSVSIVAGGGADRIFVDSNGDNPVTVNGGNGNDTVTLGDASLTLDGIESRVNVASSSGSDVIALRDDNASDGDTYDIDLGIVRRASFGLLTFGGLPLVQLYSGGGADGFDIGHMGDVVLQIDGQGGLDELNFDESTSSGVVRLAASQDFSVVNTGPGTLLQIVGDAGLLLASNLSTVEGNVSLDRGWIVERNSQVAGGLGYWRERLENASTGESPRLSSPFADNSAIGDAIGYGYAQDLALTDINGIALDDGDLVLRYTLRGDANLDVAVNFDDLLVLAQNYGVGTARTWTQGDFDLDRATGFDDLLALAQNYGGTAVVTQKRATATRRGTAMTLA